MKFNIPTNKTQLINTLQELFNYYRIQRVGYEEIEFVSLKLSRLTYDMPKDYEITEMARIAVAADQEREKRKYEQELNLNIAKADAEISVLDTTLQSAINEINALFDQSIEKVNAQARKNGLISSGIVVDKVAELEEKRNEEIIEKTNEFQGKIAALNALKASYTQALSETEEYFALAHEKDVAAKAKEIKEECIKTRRSVEKYNNYQDEKEKRYENTKRELNAELKIRFMELSTGELTKDQLTEMGYYEDVIACVCGYYDTLEAAAAYRDFASDKKLPIYLDHYYENILYMYRAKSGN